MKGKGRCGLILDITAKDDEENHEKISALLS
jgi:hypothetical protein